MALIHIDLDDTVVEFLQGVCNLHNANRHPSEHLTVYDLDDWDRNGEVIEPYINQEGLFTNLVIKPNAVEVLRWLSKRHDVKILTAFPTAQSAKEKVDFVAKHLPFIPIKNMTLSWNKQLIKGDLLFDDSPKFLPFFEGYKICFDKPYNKNLQTEATDELDRVDYRVNSWLEFKKAIIELEKQGKLVKD